MIFIKQTKETAEKLLADIKRFLFLVTILVQCVFFVYYVYSIYVNIHKPIFCAIYSSLFLLSIVAFINYLVTHKYPKDSLKGFSRFLRIFKYFINFSLIFVNFYSIIKFSGTFINFLLLVISLFSLFFQIVIEVIRYFVEQQIKAIKLKKATNQNTDKTDIKDKLTKIKDRIFKR